MTLRSVLGTRLVAAACALTMSAVACSDKHDKSATVSSKLTVKGVVTDEDNKPVANANISIGDITVQTSATGEYTVEPNYQLGETGVFNVVASGFGTRSTPVMFDEVGLAQNFMLRKHTVTQQVALPAVAGANVQVSYKGTDPNAGGITLILEANQLVNAAGAAIQGNVDVAITYWGPNDPLTNTPAPLAGYNNANDLSNGAGLISYGMGDIDIRQGNELLHLATGANLKLAFNVPPAFATNLNELVTSDASYPQLWSVDTSTGVWVLEGGLANGRIAYDATAGVINAQLPHLSAWNIDGVVTNEREGCVTGTLVDCNNKPVPNFQAWLWLIGKSTIMHTALNSGADGTFCAPLTGAGSFSNASRTQASGEAIWWVSLPQLPSETSQCNATGRSSFANLCGKNGPDTMLCRQTEHDSDDGKWDATIKACGSKEFTFKMCGYCANKSKPSGRCMVRVGDGEPHDALPFTSGLCSSLGNVQVPTAACKNVNQTKDPCAGKGDMTGQECKVDADCCPQNALECSDGRCVPRTADVN